MDSKELMIAELDRKIRAIESDCQIRLAGLEVMIVDVSRNLNDREGTLNNLGEFQSWVNMLDCRLATLSELRNLRKNFQLVS